MIRIPVYKNGKIACYAKVSDRDRRFAKYLWRLMANKYIARHDIGKTNKMIYMHREIVGLSDPKKQVDHINFDLTDNRRSNLRIATSKENAQHRQMHKKNTSGYRGVTWSEDCQGWIAQVHCGGKAFYLGVHPTARKAGAAAAKKRREFGFPEGRKT